MWAWFYQWDLGILRWINGEAVHPWLDQVMAIVSSFRLFLVPLALAVLGLVVWGRFRERLLLVTMALCLVVGDGGINWGMKRLVHRPRPHETLSGVRVVTTDEVYLSQPVTTSRGRSFTSGHACNNVALALVAVTIYGRWAWGLWGWALLVSYSRIYVGSHYPSDILGSWLVAIGYSLAMMAVMEWWWGRYAARYFPNLWQTHSKLFGIHERP
jgi:undecaprenyl-diphosphatase